MPVNILPPKSIHRSTLSLHPSLSSSFSPPWGEEKTAQAAEKESRKRKKRRGWRRVARRLRSGGSVVARVLGVMGKGRRVAVVRRWRRGVEKRRMVVTAWRARRVRSSPSGFFFC
jgi:hypothetical protein